MFLIHLSLFHQETIGLGLFFFFLSLYLHNPSKTEASIFLRDDVNRINKPQRTCIKGPFLHPSPETLGLPADSLC